MCTAECGNLGGYVRVLRNPSYSKLRMIFTKRKTNSNLSPSQHHSPGLDLNVLDTSTWPIK